MKNRIIALVLVVIMSLLALSSCGSYNFAEEDMSDYVSFNYATFKEALGKIEIEDGDFTTDEATRLKITAAKIYSAVVDKIVASTEEEKRNTTFKEALTAGDVLYFVYYAVGKDSDGNEYRFDSAHMDVSYITNSTYKAQHVVKLDNYYYSEADTLLGLIKDAVLANLASLNPYSTKTKAQLEADFADQWKEDHDGKSYEDMLDTFKLDHRAEKHSDDSTCDETTCYNVALQAFKDEYANAKADAIKVKEGNTYYVSYTRTYETPKIKYELDENNNKKLDENGNPIPVKDPETGKNVYETDNDGNIIYETVTEKAVYEAITLNKSNPLHAILLDERVTASVGDTAFKAYLSDKEGAEGEYNTSSTFPVIFTDAPETVKDGKYTYSSFAIKWMVEKEGTPITVPHTPETKKDNTNDDGVVEKVEKTPDNLTVSGEKVDIVGMEWTYYVFPVYAIDAPLTSELTAYDILYHIYGSKLTATSLEILGEEYKNGEETLEALLKEISMIFDTKSTVEGNTYYKEGGALYQLNKDYNDAVTAGGSKPTDEQQTKIDDTLKALNDKQDEMLVAAIEKIVAATKDGKTLGDEIFKYNAEETDPTKVYTGEYYKNNYHTLKESYDSDIIKKVQTKVWELIDEMVEVTVDKIPAEVVKEYVDHLYESYEYDFYKGNYTSSSSSSSSSSSATISNYDHYKTDGVTEKQAYNNYLYDVLLKDTEYETVDEAIKAEAQKYLVPIIKIFAVARACETDALAVYKTYVEQDIAGGAYNVDREYYDELYPNDAKKAEKKYNEAVENAKENQEASLKEAEMFLINDAFMKNYKKEVGRDNYNSAIERYGEINLRTGFQFNKLFYYLTSTDIELNEDGDHTETVYKDGKLAFRTITYTLKADDAETGTDAQ